ncbi:hypothetical protein RhiirA4_541369 [Rhizophagus irregularis]|uniref:Uncharacterized protein n=1 Tax=Rhizophagus irregularis TaxID=588596 RepID=A0A2I1GAY8_9GLOM|nr:hypothetical protein RhiirA4_541369 [Rhizophagus irregularis]
MSSKLELLEQRIADLEAENAKIKEEYDDLESERIIEENARRDAENAEHKVRIEELEKNSADISAENSELKAELTSPHLVTQTSSQWKREMDTFLDEVYKKRVSDEIRQRNREKKLLRELATQDLSSVTQEKKSQSHKNREAENIVRDPVQTIMIDHFSKNPLPEDQDDDSLVSAEVSISTAIPLTHVSSSLDDFFGIGPENSPASSHPLIPIPHVLIKIFLAKEICVPN